MKLLKNWGSFRGILKASTAEFKEQPRESVFLKLGLVHGDFKIDTPRENIVYTSFKAVLGVF